MVRSRSAFEVCKFAEANAEATCDGEDHRQLFTVDEISEDVVLGSRLHAAGFKGVFVAENLATGEVGPLVSLSGHKPPPPFSVAMYNIGGT